MCKIFKVPVDNEIFENVNESQYLWYQIQISLDKEDNFELSREIAEHNAMFTNPEGVKKIREARENTYELTDDQFDSVLEDVFGRKLGKDDVDKYLDMELDEIKFTPDRG